MPPGNFSAFPLMPPLDPSGNGSAGGFPYPEIGLTKRELFAAMAMQAILTGSVMRACPSHEWFQMDAAVHVADALLAALARNAT